MDPVSRTAATPVQSAASIAKAALRRLAHAQQEPTPENYARAYAEESGTPQPVAAQAAEPDAKAAAVPWAALVERLAKNLDRGGKQWTSARRKDSLKRVFDSSRSDAERLLQRMQSLMTAWESDHPDDPTQPPVAAASLDLATKPIEATAASGPAVAVQAVAVEAPQAWAPVISAFESSLRAGLPPDVPSATSLADELQALAQALASEGLSAQRVAAVEAVCQQARRLFGQRHQLVEALASLCQDLGAGLTELSEDGSWVQGQCQLLQSHLHGGGEPEQAAPAQPAVQRGHSAALSVRGARAASAVLAHTRQQQKQVRDDRLAARDALKQLIQRMLQEVGELGEHTGRFELATSQHAQAVESADSLESLAGVVRAMLADARTVHSAVTATQVRLQADHLRATELESKVLALEGELRRLSSEVSTDALTQVANRRGLTQAFEMERARAERAGGGLGSDAATTLSGGAASSKSGLAVALIDIDNFKKLNDSLGHSAGDQALKTLAAAVRERLRPVDHLARFGGEEFVVLLPGTEVKEAQQALTRLQRSLTEALFLHEGREVFVTFSAGVTQWRTGETLEASLERADEALYEAKRTGKNRTCVG
jgi:diguanylate cyclase